MADAELGPLPDYENPPVIETVLGVQFERLPRATNAHWGAFWKSLGDRWPSVADAPPLPSQFERFDARAWASGLRFEFTQDPACRVQIRNADGSRMIQVQNTRLHLNWLKRPDQVYPRYETIRDGSDGDDGFIPIFERFAKFVTDQQLGEFRPNQWEVTYVNDIPRGTVWETPADWGFFAPLAGMPDIVGLISAESFGGEWHFGIPGERGRLHVNWQHAKGKEGGLSDWIRLTFTARGPILDADHSVSAVVRGLDLGRETIVRAFDRLMSDHARSYWGSRHGNSHS